MSQERAVIHVDMDAFYASVEQRDDPSLRGKPVVVGGTGPRGVVAAASYEVREFGVRSAMPMREALRRCPEAICIRPRMARYREISGQVFAVFHRFTPLVEGLSLDEAFLDVSDARVRHGDMSTIGRRIKDEVRSETGLTASVGIGPNKLLAKIASDLDKPDGFLHITAQMARTVLDPLPVTAIGGIGPRTATRLHAAGIRTLGELRQAADGRLRPIFGRYTGRVQARAAGRDDRPVTPEHPDKSISAEETYDRDIGDREALADHLMALVDRVASRLRRKEMAAGVVFVKIRRADFATFTRQQRFSPPTSDTVRLYALALALLERWLAASPGVRVRLLGAGVAELTPANQLSLFDAEPRSPLDQTVDRIRRRFGSASVRRGTTLR